MTLAELEAATARLGFTPSLDDGGELLRDAATRAIGDKLIEKELEKIPHEKVRAIAKQNIADIKASNRRDFRF